MPAPDPELVRARAGALLLEAGDRLAEATLRRSRLHIDLGADDWSLSGHKVPAYRAQLLVAHEIMLRFQEHPDLRERIRAALRTAFDAREGVLHDISIALDPSTLSASGYDASLEDHPYRTTATNDTRPVPSVLRAAAERYASLAGDAECEALLSRAQLQCEPTAPPSHERTACYRVHVRVGLEDLARAAHVAGLRQRVADVVRIVGTTPAVCIGDVTLTPMLAGAIDVPRSTGPSRNTALLQDLLAAEGIVSVVISAIERGTRLVVHYRGQTALLDLVEGEGVRAAGNAMMWIEAGVEGPDPAGTARRLRDLLGRGDP